MRIKGSENVLRTGHNEGKTNRWKQCVPYQVNLSKYIAEHIFWRVKKDNFKSYKGMETVKIYDRPGTRYV